MDGDLIKSLNNFPADVLTKICELAGVERKSICYELKQFPCQFESFHPKLSECTTKIVDQHNVQQDLLFENMDSDNDVDKENVLPIDCNKCNRCIACAYITIRELTFNSNTFNNLFVLYKYVLLLPSTQVTCERVFSKLKLVKSKLRSTISQEHLTPLMLMNVEKDIEIDKEHIINCIAGSSDALKRLLTL